MRCKRKREKKIYKMDDPLKYEHMRKRERERERKQKEEEEKKRSVNETSTCHQVVELDKSTIY